MGRALGSGVKWRESSAKYDLRFVFVENSPLLVGRGLAVVLGDLAEMGYDAQWSIVSASDLDAPHQRERIWIMANDNGMRESQPARQQQECGMGSEQRSEAMANSNSFRRHWGPGHQGRKGGLNLRTAVNGQLNPE